MDFVHLLAHLIAFYNTFIFHSQTIIVAFLIISHSTIYAKQDNYTR